MSAEESTGRYARLMSHIFDAGYTAEATRVPFTRDDIVEAATTLGIPLPKNLGDVVYALRYRITILRVNLVPICPNLFSPS